VAILPAPRTPNPEGVARQIRQRHILDIDDLQARAIGTGGSRRSLACASAAAIASLRPRSR